MELEELKGGDFIAGGGAARREEWYRRGSGAGAQLVVRHVEMLLVEEALELVVKDSICASDARPRKRCRSANSSEWRSMCSLGKRPERSPRTSAAGYRSTAARQSSISLCCPLVLVQQMIVQLLQPAREDGVRGLVSAGQVLLVSSSCAECCAAVLLDPLADLGPVELEQVTLARRSQRNGLSSPASVSPPHAPCPAAR